MLIVTLHVNGFIAPTTTDKLAEGIQQQAHYICCLEETHFRPRDRYRQKLRIWQETFHAHGNQRKPGVTILISEEIDFKIKTISRNKQGHYTLIKGSNQGEDLRNAITYEPNRGALQYIRYILTAIKRNMTVKP